MDEPKRRGRTVTEDRKLTRLRPEVAEEFDQERNPLVRLEDLGVGSATRCWWRCSSCGHQWESSVNNRVRSGCPRCWRARQHSPRSRQPLAVTDPHLLSEWDFLNNEASPFSITRGANAEYRWTCRICGHRWRAAPHNRYKGSGCPSCGHP